MNKLFDRAAVIDDGELYVFRIADAPFWGPTASARKLRGRPEGLWVLALDEDVTTFYPWHVVQWCD